MKHFSDNNFHHLNSPVTLINSTLKACLIEGYYILNIDNNLILWKREIKNEIQRLKIIIYVYIFDIISDLHKYIDEVSLNLLTI